MHGTKYIINKEKYPLDQPGTGVWKTLTENCKSSFQKTGAVILKNFVQQPILERMIAETDRTIHRSHFCEDNHNVFFEEDNSALPADHPFWPHPKITISPHIASVTQPRSAAREIVANIRRLQAGEAPHNIVDTAAGY